MDAPAAPTSLQRFVLGHGKDFAALDPQKVMGRTFRSMAGWIVLMPAVVILAGILTESQSFEVKLAVTPAAILIAGAVTSVGMTKGFGRSMKTIHGDRTKPIVLQNGVSVTPEAQEMVSMLSMRYSSVDPAAIRARQQVRETGMKYQRKFTRQAMDVAEGLRLQSEQKLASMPARVNDLLEQAAFDYNRTVGLVETEGFVGSGPGILKGADEAMVAVLHQARQIVKYPESLSAFEGRLAARVDSLRQLADSVQALASAQGVAPPAALNDLLGELRLKLAALAELSAVGEVAPHRVQS